MTTAPYEGLIPEFTQADRLRKARNLTGLRVPEFAERMGVSPKTINNAESGKHAVRKIVLNQWSLITGVPLIWLETGNAPESTNGPEGGESGRRDSNSQHSAWNLDSQNVVQLKPVPHSGPARKKVAA